jgi:predicted kinase
MSNLTVLVGIPGCGKTTWATTFRPFGYKSPYAHISSDAIREELTGDVNSQERNDEVFNLFRERIRQALGMGVDVIADATHLTSRSRDETRALARKPGAALGAPADIVHAVVFANPMQALRQNRTRDRVVPEHVMFRMLDRYEQTLRDIPHEPFDTITYISEYRSRLG